MRGGVASFGWRTFGIVSTRSRARRPCHLMGSRARRRVLRGFCGEGVDEGFGLGQVVAVVGTGEADGVDLVAGEDEGDARGGAVAGVGGLDDRVADLVEGESAGGAGEEAGAGPKELSCDEVEL